MTIFDVAAILISLTALISYANARYLRLPTTIGVMLIALLGSLALAALQALGYPARAAAADLLSRVDFDDTLLQGMLSYLLFAGALHLNLGDLKDQKWPVAALSIAGVVISTFVFGTAIHFILGWLRLPLGYAWCLLFGALISPTDPISVLAILKTARVPKTLQLHIAAESLFNDGIAVVVFLACHEIAIGGGSPTPGHIAAIFALEAGGGAALGLGLGWVTFRLLKSVDNYQVEILLTLALVTGGYALASALGASGPIAIVTAGVLIGNHGRAHAMSETTRQHLDLFWDLVDEILNTLLFALIGFEVLIITFSTHLLLAGLLAIPAVLLARWVSVGLPVALLDHWSRFQRGTVAILTWGGLRGGISVALALSLPAGREREIVVGVTYIIVVFSILVQGMTVRRVARRVLGQPVPA